MQERKPDTTRAEKTLVVGLGNTILTDDGVGIYVAREAALRWAQRRCLSHSANDNVTFAEASVGGLRLLDILAGYERVILVDAIQTPNGHPGEIYRLHPRDLLTPLHTGSAHDLSLTAALALGKQLGMTLPDEDNILIVAIEVEDTLTFSEQCTPAVAAAIPSAAEAILQELEHSRRR